MKLLRYFFFFLLTCITGNQITEARQLSVFLDVAIFRYNDSLSQVEIYYSIPDSNLTYIQKNDTLYSEVQIHLEINLAGKIIEKKHWIITHSRLTKNFQPFDLLGQKNFVLPAGNYIFNTTFMDINDSTNLKKISKNVNLSTFSNKKLTLSGLQISRQIEKADTNQKKWNLSFFKNQLLVIPNPSLEIIGTKPVINSYLEIYNAKKSAPDGILISYRLFDASGQEVLMYPRKRKPEHDGLIEIIALPVDALTSGIYNFEITVSSQTGDHNDSVKSSKKIYLLNPEMPPVSSGGGFTENLDFELSEFSTMSESKIEEEFQQVSYIASEYETELFNNCATHEAKQRFLFGFWKRRNPDTTKAVNEARENYRKQIAVSNKKFAYAKMKDGWRTDRGRILLKYGEPTTIEYHVQEGEKKAYEIWYYDSLMGGVQFIFADWKRNGFYILVHSNMPNETRNDNWYKDYILK